MSTYIIIAACVSAGLAAVNSIWAHERISNLRDELTDVASRKSESDRKTTAASVDVSFDWTFTDRYKEPRHAWTITERNGEWHWRIEIERPSVLGIHFEPSLLAKGTEPTRERAERKVWRWFWNDYRNRVCPPIDAATRSGAREIKGVPR